MIIAIDGPAGAGKTTVARSLARSLRLTHIDTGAMYRAIALYALRNGVGPEDEPALATLARQAQISFQPGDRAPSSASETGQRVLLDGEDVTLAIREPAVTRLASPISAISSVRRALVMQQRAMASAGDVVMEGRDIGTVVLPHADVKVFLTASPEVRAQRRLLELRARGVTTDFPTVLREIQERDARDSTRADSPMVPAPDAVVLDTDNLTVEQVTARIAELAGLGP